MVALQRSLNCTATLMTQNYNQARAQVRHPVFDGAQRMVVDQIARRANDEKVTAVRESSKLIRRDLKFVAVGIAEINRVRDFVILKFEFNAVTFQFFLGGEKILSVRAQRQMKHADIPTPARSRFFI